MPPLSRQLVANLSLVVFTRVPICASGAGCVEVWLTNVPSACSTSPHTPVWKTNVITSRVFFFLPFPPPRLPHAPAIKVKTQAFPCKAKDDAWILLPRSLLCLLSLFKTKLEHGCCFLRTKLKGSLCWGTMTSSSSGQQQSGYNRLQG